MYIFYSFQVKFKQVYEFCTRKTLKQYRYTDLRYCFLQNHSTMLIKKFGNTNTTMQMQIRKSVGMIPYNHAGNQTKKIQCCNYCAKVCVNDSTAYFSIILFDPPLSPLAHLSAPLKTSESFLLVN